MIGQTVKVQPQSSTETSRWSKHYGTFLDHQYGNMF